MTTEPRKTWTALMLAASTLALTALPAAAQEATATEEGAAADPLLLEGDLSADAAATGETAEGDTLLAEEGAGTDAAATTEAGTELAVDDAATGEAGTDGTLTAEGEAEATEAEATETELAADDATAEETADETVVAEEGAETDAAADAETDLAADDAAADEADETLTAEGEAEATEVETDLAADDATAEETADETVVAEEDAEIDATADDATADDMADDTVMADEGTEAEADATLTAEGAAATEGADATTELAEGEAAAGDDAMTADAGEVASPPQQPGEDMQAVLDELAELGAQPLSTLTVEEARTQPTPADAVMALMEERGMKMPAELAGILTRDITYPGADGSQIAARVYTPPEGEGPFPLIVYFHGGGWVIAGFDVYDASARALAAGANAVVVSATYRQAPEHTFPAQHEDANAAYEWIVENSGEFNADAERLAVAGESAGGNLAVNVAIHARDAQLVEPDHVVAVYPIASDDMELPSYETYADAMPLSREGMMWFFDHVFEDPSQAADPRIDLIERTDLQGLPPVTIVNAEIDPLQSEGEILAMRLMEAGVPVQQMTYQGVTHEFFGMGAVVPAAQEAVDVVAANLRQEFGVEGAEGLVNDAATADATATEDGLGGEVRDVEATAAETTDPMATEGEDAMEMETTTEPMEGELATQDN